MVNGLGSIKIKLRQYFKSKPVKRVYLFGSFAKNKQNNNSDIDILVDFDHKISIGLDYCQMFIDLKNIFRKEVDIVSSDSISKYLKPYIDKEKILIYEKKTG